MEIVILIIYCALGYWAVGQTIYRNKIRIGTLNGLFTQRVIMGILFGFILIPVAIIAAVFRGKSE